VSTGPTGGKRNRADDSGESDGAEMLSESSETATASDAPPASSTRVPARAREKSAWPQRRKVGSLLHMWERLEVVQRMLASAMPPSKVTAVLMAEHGLERHDAEHYQAVVRARWRQNASREDGEQEFLRLKAIVQQAVEDAATRKVTVRTGSDPDTKEPIYEIVEQPDSKAVIAGAALWARMIGRLDPPQPGGGALPANGETPAASSEVQVVDRQDMHETLRAMRAKASGGG
jgi:hypothetical protein